MKLKTILGMAVAACAALVMSVAVSAATDVKTGDITTKGSYVVVPVVISTTDMKELDSYDVTVNYDSSKFTCVRVVDTLKYTDPIFGEEANYGTITSNPNYADGQVRFNWFFNNADKLFPTPDVNGIRVADVYFTANTTDYSKNDFTITKNMIADMAGTSFECKSFFAFDVTGDLGGNEVVALAASTDGGATKQPLTKYLSTDWAEGTEYAAATTKFLVAVDNTKGADAVTNITIYGEKADGTYIPLTSLDQTDFLVQDFK